MAATYEPIATQTLSTAAASVTFSGIPQTYTDLILVTNVKCVGADSNMRATFNGDTGNNYSTTYLDGDGSTATSSRTTNQAVATIGYVDTSDVSTNIIQLQSYSSDNVNKTVLVRAASAVRGLSSAIVNLWRDTDAINSITLDCYGGGSARNFESGSTFTLYGIKAA